MSEWELRPGRRRRTAARWARLNAIAPLAVAARNAAATTVRTVAAEAAAAAAWARIAVAVVSEVVAEVLEEVVAGAKDWGDSWQW